MTESTIDYETGEIVPVAQDPAALASLFGKLARVMGRLERLPRTGHNSHFNYDFVTDGDVSDTVRAALAAEGVAFFATMRGVSVDGKKVTAHFTYTFGDGETGATWSCNWQGEAIDTQDKGTAKAATSALKYFLLKTFVLSSGDQADDTDADAAQAKQAKPSGNGNQSGKVKFFTRVLDEIPFYENVEHVASALRKAGFKRYDPADETKMFEALEQAAQQAANAEAVDG